jgi:L-threonate 2-dehydrogenase
MTLSTVGVIGTGAMGLGVVKSLVRGGYRVLARDIDMHAESAAVASGAEARSSPASLARECTAVIVLVVDAAQIDAVFFGTQGNDGAVQALAPGSVVFLSSTVAPGYVAAQASALASRGIVLVDAPVSGGPQRATAGTMTMMLAGDVAVIAAFDAMLNAVAATRFIVGERPGDAATFKILNNQLAAVNLAAGAEAMALAIRAGLDPRQFFDIVNASSGASWIFADRMARALDADYTPRAATTLLAKDVGIAVDAAKAWGLEPSFARVAHDAFTAALHAKFGAEDDAAMLKFYLQRAASDT